MTSAAASSPPSSSSASAQRALRAGLGSLLSIMAVAAFGGGVYGMLGAPAVPVGWLVGSPFDSYVVPGAYLFVVVGGAFALAARGVFGRRTWGRVAAFAAGAIALTWIAAQVYVIGLVSFLQPAVSVIGVLVLAMAALLPRAADLTNVRPTASLQ